VTLARVFRWASAIMSKMNTIAHRTTVTGIEASLRYDFAGTPGTRRLAHNPTPHSCARTRNLKFCDTGAGVSMGISDHE